MSKMRVLVTFFTILPVWLFAASGSQTGLGDIKSIPIKAQKDSTSDNNVMVTSQAATAQHTTAPATETTASAEKSKKAVHHHIRHHHSVKHHVVHHHVVHHVVHHQTTAKTAVAKQPSPSSDAANINQADSLSSSSFQQMPPVNNNNHFILNGFVSAGAAATSAPVSYLIPGHGTLHNDVDYEASSLAGFQLTANLNKYFGGTIQLVANGDDTNGHTPYVPQVDWAFVTAKPLKNLSVRAGRLRLPLFMYSSTQEIGYTYTWMFLPSEVYRLVPFSSMNGFDATYQYRISDDWMVKVSPFIGASKSTFDFYPTATTKVPVNFEEDNIWGASVSVSHPHFMVRAAFSQTQLNSKPEAKISLPGLNNVTASFFDLGLKANYMKFIFNGEFAYRQIANNILADMSAFYGMVGYHYESWLPNITYAKLQTTNSTELAAEGLSLFDQSQQSVTFGLNYYFNSNVVAKASVSMIQPQDNTAGLFSAMPAKKTVYLYGVSLDAVF